MLSLTVKYGDSVQIAENINIRVMHKSGRNVRLIIDTPLTPITIIPKENRDELDDYSEE